MHTLKRGKFEMPREEGEALFLFHNSKTKSNFMIQFNYIGNPFPSFQEQQEDKDLFIEKLGPFKNEFDAKGGTVIFNHSYPDTDQNRVCFSLGGRNAGELGDFIMRWNEYIRDIVQRENIARKKKKK